MGVWRFRFQGFRVLGFRVDLRKGLRVFGWASMLTTVKRVNLGLGFSVSGFGVLGWGLGFRLHCCMVSGIQ